MVSKGVALFLSAFGSEPVLVAAAVGGCSGDPEVGTAFGASGTPSFGVVGSLLSGCCCCCGCFSAGAALGFESAIGFVGSEDVVGVSSCNGCGSTAFPYLTKAACLREAEFEKGAEAVCAQHDC